MADPIPDMSSALQGPLNSHPPDTDADIIPDASFALPERTHTNSTMSNSSDKSDTCRICRSEGTPEEPLFYPCKCSGSIKFVHQECLMEWLSHSHKKHCELCKTPFRFTKLYDANMPQKLPWTVFVRRACVHLVMMLGRGCRAVMVSAVWLVILPWLVRWAWRWMFWMADAGWAREAFMDKMQQATLESSITQINETAYSIQAFSKAFTQLVNVTINSGPNSTRTGPTAYQFAKDVFAKSVGFYNGLTDTTANSTMPLLLQDTPWPQPDTSILSSWTYLSQLSSNSRLNRVVLDVFEGQLITCVVIVGFILVFLIREWVVQQQPLVNLENLGIVQAHLREAAERVQADNERLRRQQELLEQARRRLIELQNETTGVRAFTDDVRESAEPFIGWTDLDKLIDIATEHLRRDGEGEREQFVECAQIVTKQIQLAGRVNRELDVLTEKLSEKLSGYSPEERREWEKMLMAEVEKMGKRIEKSRSDPGMQRASAFFGTEEDAEASGSTGRPPMQDRDFSSRATQIQRLLEEAEGIFQPQERGGSARAAELPADTASNTDSASLISAPSPTESWQHVSPPGERTAADNDQRQGQPEQPLSSDEMPITNAGPDAKVNIRRSGKGKARAVPEPTEVTDAEKKKRQDEDDAMKKLEEEIKAEDAARVPQSAVSGVPLPADAQQQQPSDQTESNPFHPDGPPAPERRQSETLSHRVASAFREEFGLDEAEELENLRQAGLGPDGQPAPNDGQLAEAPQRRLGEPVGHAQRLADWFWGDIGPQQAGASEPVPAPNEERAEQAEQEAPFAPVTNVQPAINPAPADQGEHEHVHHHDPEVLAAAAQAGLDADAIEDAEDLEGIFELIGFQGPLIGLFQTSTFCTILVIGTVFGAVGLPYIWGKLVLNFVGSPAYFLIQMPLQIASTVADFVVDITLLVGGWLVFVGAVITNLAFSALAKWAPSLGSVIKVPEWVTSFAMATAGASGGRLQSLFMTQEPLESEVISWNWAFLGASVHSHASLRYVQSEVGAILDYIGSTITSVTDTVSTGSFAEIWTSILDGVAQIPAVPAKLLAGMQALEQYTQPLLKSLGLLKTGSLTFETPIAPVIDPSLVYWSSADRSLAVIAGYLSLAAIAAVYVAIDQPITRSEQGRKTEKLIRDTLRQAGGVLKVILIISIEMLVFPLYCGLLLDFAFLPLFQEASVATRWSFAKDRAVLFCFVHWFIGTCYMFHFALFVGMCRKILRKGVLWFIRDPDDPTFHPVRDVLERNVTTQLRKIAFSALVYGALVILCLGGVIWGIGQVFEGIFPIYWVSTEPVLEFPMDLLLYNAVTPLLIRLFKPSDAVNSMYAWWLRRCARVLRLSHFLFDDRRKDEEGQHVRKGWASFLLMRKAPADVTPSGIIPEDRRLADESDSGAPEVYFTRDGKYVLTPCNDQYRPPKPGEAFLHFADDDEDVYIADKEGKKNDHFAKVYVPPYFRFRITLFMVCLWMFSAFMGLCATLVPLCFGRQVFASVMPTGMRVNDIYAYTVGAYSLGGALFVVLQGRSAARYLREKSPVIDIAAWTAPAKRYGMRALKCVYVYGFIGVVLPTLFALMLQFYVILPLHTYIVSSMAESASSAVTEQASTVAANVTAQLGEAFVQSMETADTNTTAIPTLAKHTIHILQDYCLGLLYVRLATRFILTAPASRAAEAFRRITADGYLNPNVRLATRFLVAPIMLLAACMLVLPPMLAQMAITAVELQSNDLHHAGLPLDDEAQTKIFRYSYPVAAGLVMLLLCGTELGRATSRWRARIRDEVYLVGERLHNFGEKKPPPHSKSVVRKER
ncbi:hypothetical protein LTR85_002378 [Meristemomyces frigidus]|nr:hypothetical protein LTR85_002378 [Meristemomyces frigidus]